MLYNIIVVYKFLIKNSASWQGGREMMEKSLKFEKRNHALRKNLFIVVAIIVTFIDAYYFVYKLKLAFPWEFGNYYSSVEREITTVDIVLTFVMIFFIIMVCSYLINISEWKMSHNISRIIFDYLSLRDCVQVELKQIYGVQHNADVFFSLTDEVCKLYVKSLNDKKLYIWASNEKGEEMEHWIETPSEFFHYFTIKD